MLKKAFHVSGVLGASVAYVVAEDLVIIMYSRAQISEYYSLIFYYLVIFEKNDED